MRKTKNITENSAVLDDIIIYYGKTTVRELLDAGYTVADFEQIVEEPFLAVCNLRKGNMLVAILSFYDISEEITIEQLADYAVDLVLSHDNGRTAPKREISRTQAIKNKIAWTLLVHLFAVVAVFCIFGIPELFSWLQEWGRAGKRSSIGAVIIVLPAFLITFIWSGDADKKSISGKILLSLWMIVNVAVSLAYIIAIHMLFNQ